MSGGVCGAACVFSVLIGSFRVLGVPKPRPLAPDALHAAAVDAEIPPARARGRAEVDGVGGAVKKHGHVIDKAEQGAELGGQKILAAGRDPSAQPLNHLRHAPHRRAGPGREAQGLHAPRRIIRKA